MTTMPSFDRRAIPAGVVESHWNAPDGWPIRRIDWPTHAAPRGAILFFPGRGDFYEKYLESLDHWHRLGWNVTAMDWRGQAGSGRLGNDEFTGHIDDFSIWIDDLAQFWQEWSATTPGPHVLAAHSMGGHLALRAMAEGRINPAGAILFAPMLAFAGLRLPLLLLHAVARLMTWIGDPRRPAWKWSEKPGQVSDARVHLLTNDQERYADELWWREARPEIAMGPGSWGWVERAYASMRALFRPGLLENIRVPVLIVATDGDRLVGWSTIARAAARLPQCELVRFGQEAHHELLRESDAVRNRVLAACDAFLDRIGVRP